METDRIIASIAARQHAAVGRRQLLDAGVPAHVITHRVRKGLLIPVHAGVYRVAGSTVTWHQRIMAATLAAGAGAVASHRAAAFLHGLDGVEPRAEVTVARHRGPETRGVVVHRLDLARADVELRDGIPRTRLPATILGLAAVVSAPALEMALDDALLKGLVDTAQLRRRLDAGNRRGRPGAAALAELLTVRAGSARWTQSEFERRLLRLVAGAGLALPVPQFEVHADQVERRVQLAVLDRPAGVLLPDGSRVYLDFAWPEIRVALEAQSYRHHAGRVAWSRDQSRNAILASIGWRLIPATWEDLVTSPRALLATIQRAHAA